ncbi:uncharacterized protein LOC110981295 isoform X2 [Acanthaster planci]|uniref:Uncharacterized protein LOC110981295 isoform X2 n=1 Tax=Acanthaster planci TaxID=133434 RepID=A0A8B7YMI0_ACAPL|nr:uncharacterized protein LOC110981295 isoform X2 [Acanthaster planci]
MAVQGEKVFLSVLLWCTLSFLSVRGDMLLRSVGFSQPATSNVALTNHVLKSLRGVRSTGRCLAHCLPSPLCVAVNYKEAAGTCELSTSRKDEYPDDLVSEVGWQYYEKVLPVVENLFSIPMDSYLQTTAKMPTLEPTTKTPTTEMPTTTEIPTTTRMFTTEMSMTTEIPTTTRMFTTEMSMTTEIPTTTRMFTTEMSMTTEIPTTEMLMTTEETTTEAPTTVHVTTEKPPVDCWDIHSSSPTSPSGEYAVYPKAWENQLLKVYCDMTTDLGGWTRRLDSSQNFYLDWNSYKVGFGAIGGSFWLGNDALNVLTSQGAYQLRIELESYDSVKTFVKYGYVSVADEARNYRLNVTSFYGSYTADDALSADSGQAFTTKDVDNDNDGDRQCAQALQSAWWFGSCGYCHLNGPYQGSASVPSRGVGLIWGPWLGYYESLKFTEMKIRPISAQPIPKDCWDLYQSGHSSSGVYTIYVTGRPEGLTVLCDMEFDGGGWTTIQKREIGDLDFYRGWADYKAGFGTVDTESDFWLGLDDIHLLTNQDSYQIRIIFVSWGNIFGYARYSEFRINNEADNYRLTIGGYAGNAGDSLITYHNGMPWSTLDRDNDKDARQCAQVMRGAWWYNNCQTSNLNGPYVEYPGYLSTNGQGIIWSSWPGQDDSLAKVQMKIRPTNIGY